MTKTILAFDTSMSLCSVSLFYKKKTYSINKICCNNHSTYILPMIKEVLSNNNISIHQVDIIATSKGPGNFSGIRIAISVAQGLSLGLNFPSVITFSSVLIMAEQVWNIYNIPKVTAIIFINKKNISWVQYVRNSNNLWIKKSKKMILNIIDVHEIANSLKDKWALVGNGWNVLSKNVLKKFYVTNIIFPHSKYIISLILSNMLYEKKTLLHEISPIYFQKTQN